MLKLLKWNTIMGSMGVADNFTFLIFKSVDEPNGAIDTATLN